MNLNSKLIGVPDTAVSLFLPRIDEGSIVDAMEYKLFMGAVSRWAGRMKPVEPKQEAI